jgi:hypothetical protein
MLFDAAAKFFVSIQSVDTLFSSSSVIGGLLIKFCRHKLYYVVMSLARFNLFVNSYVYLLTKAPAGFYRNLEICGVLFFWLWFGKGVLGNIPDLGTRLGFLLLSFVVTSPLHVQVSPIVEE